MEEPDVRRAVKAAGATAAHAPEEVAEHFPGADQDLIQQCRILMWALVTTWRWRHDDQFPHGHYWRREGLNQIRAALDRYGLDPA